MASRRRRQEPQLGDLIEIIRPMYQHWAIYVGDGYVVHLVPPSEVPTSGSGSIMSVVCDRAVVRKQLLREAVGNNEYRINNIMDGQYRPRPVSEIVRSAEMQVGRTLSYSITSKNCEHFVTELRYGKAESRQVQRTWLWLIIAGIAAAGWALLISLITRGRRRQQQ